MATRGCVGLARTSVADRTPIGHESVSNRTGIGRKTGPRIGMGAAFRACNEPLGLAPPLSPHRPPFPAARTTAHLPLPASRGVAGTDSHGRMDQPKTRLMLDGYRFLTAGPGYLLQHFDDPLRDATHAKGTRDRRNPPYSPP
jgi:hypothetical protein